MRFKSEKQRKAVMANYNNLSPRHRIKIIKDPSLKNKNFNQLKKKGIYLNYNGDADKDGIKNIKDCRPLDRKKQSKLHDLAIATLKKREQFIEERRIKAMKKLEEKKEKLQQDIAASQAELAKKKQKQAVIDEIDREKELVKKLKAQNRQAKQLLFKATPAGKAIERSKETLKDTKKFFKKPSTRRALKKIFG